MSIGVCMDICIFVYMDTKEEKLNLLPNQAVCFNCRKVLTSNDQYDMVVCACGAMAVDGGNNLRIIELRETPYRTGGLSSLTDASFTIKI